MELRSDGIIYWKAGTGKGGWPVDNSILKAMGLENKPAMKAPKAQESRRAPQETIPEKPSVQIDDMAPMGRRRPQDGE